MTKPNQHYIEVPIDCDVISYQCVHCDYCTIAEHHMLGHQATEHSKPKPKKSKRKQKPQRLVLPLQGVDKGRFIP